MAKTLTLVGSIILAIIGAGCATPGYLADRGRDARDILTVTVGVGIGAKVRTGLIHAGLLVNHDLVGLRDSAFGRYYLYMPSPGGCSLEYETAIVPVPGPYREWVFAYDFFSAPQPFNGRRLKADYEARSHVPFVTTEGARHQYYTHIEGVVGIGPSVRLGVNAGELLDFILGLGRIDIFADDIGAAKTPSNNAMQADARTSRR